MRRFRVIPILLLQEGGLVKGERFRKHRYVGDPINAVKIFNDKEVDELSILDIGATGAGRGPDFELIAQIAGEAFMPLSYGGGLTDLDQVSRILKSGIEKVIFNHSAVERPELILQTAEKFGSSSTVVSVDVKSAGLFGQKKVFIHGGTKNTGKDVVAFAQEMERLGAGELVLTSVDREGTRQGYDAALIKSVSEAVHIPVIANGGAGQLEDFRSAIAAGASAVAAGSLFVFQGKHRAVLIQYPQAQELAGLQR